MNRARVAVAATFVASTLLTTAALAAQATQAPNLQPVLAGRKFTPPLRGEALVDFTAPATKREKDLVVTRFQVKNVSTGPIARLTIAETWYDKGGAVVTGGKGVINGLLQPGEVQTIMIETPYNSKMASNQFIFTHAQGTVKPNKVAKMDAPPKEAAAKK